MLPPGKYYFVDFHYFDYTNYNPGALNLQSYVLNTYANPNTYYRKALITFDVVPGRATYIGTLDHDSYVSRDRPLRSRWDLRFKVTDQTVEAKDWLTRNLPLWANVLDTKLTEISYLPE